MLCKQVSCPKCAHRFVVALSGQSTSTGEKIHDCGFIHGDFEPCPTKVSRAFPVNQTIQPPAMFGGETVGRFSSAHPNEANGPKP